MAVNVELPNGTYLFHSAMQQHVECVQKQLLDVLDLHGAQSFQHVDVDGVKAPLAHLELVQLFQSFPASEARALKVRASCSHTELFKRLLSCQLYSMFSMFKCFPDQSTCSVRCRGMQNRQDGSRNLKYETRSQQIRNGFIRQYLAEEY